jgi:diacylglycerol kinase (ATP)
MRDRIRGARSAGFDAVLLVGGDGTVHQALPALVEEDVPFGVIPCGRGNDFARNVGIPPAGSESTLFVDPKPTVRTIDLPTVNGVPFVSVACLGFDAEVNRLAGEGRGFFGGSLGYLVCVLKALSQFEPFAAEVHIDQRRWRGRILLLAVANGSCYGGGMRIAPGALMSDGLVDVCMVGPLPKLQFLANLPRVYAGTHISHPKVTIETGRSILIETEAPMQVFADGEFVALTPAKWSIGDRTVRVVVPASSAAAANHRSEYRRTSAQFSVGRRRDAEAQPDENAAKRQVSPCL